MSHPASHDPAKGFTAAPSRTDKNRTSLHVWALDEPDLREGSPPTKGIRTSLHVWALDRLDPARGLLLAISRLVRPGFQDN